MNLKNIIRRLKNKPVSSDEYIEALRAKGISIGSGCRVFDTANIMIDTQNPYMLTIGNNVRLTRGAIILTHDYSWSVLAGVYGELLGGGDLSL